MPKFSLNLSRKVGALAIMVALAALDIAGVLGPIDRALMDLRFRLLERPASGDLVIVQIDPYSLRELDLWPWPRNYYAALIDRLLATGVREIAIDVDFSARSTEANDQALAEALARAGNRVILPGFRREAAPESAGGQVFDTLPRPEFMAHAQVGSINVSPAPDGLIRRVTDVQDLFDRRLPSFFALLAGPAAVQDRSFYIDYGIDPNTIPRVSFVDVMRGRYAHEQLAGKSVIVGTTAAELGDTLPVPLHRSMAGPAVQALAYESLRQGRDIQMFGSALSVPVSALLVVVLTIFYTRLSWRWAVVNCVVGMAAIEAAATALQAAVPIALTTAPWMGAAVLSLVLALWRYAEAQARHILEQRETIATRRALMDRMVENSFDGILIADHAGSITLVNKAAEAILRLPADEAMGRPLDEVLPGAGDLMSTIVPIWDEDQELEYWRPSEITIRRHDGMQVAIELTIGAVDLAPFWRGRQEVDAKRNFHTFTFRDISERQAAQEAQRNATEQALASSRAKTEFLANMSHELRTPLNAIIGFSDMITTEVFGPIEPPNYGDYVADIGNAGKHLLKIINDVLDVSRIELGQSDLREEEVDSADLLQSCIKIAKGWPNSTERDFTFDLAPGLPSITGDARILKQTVINLLSNAFKFSGKGDCIALSAALDPEGALVIVVKDSGIGIAQENLPKLTEAFYQVDGSHTREFEGVGLGLFLVTSFVNLHGGEFSIDSELGVGTTATVRLPAERVLRPSNNAVLSA